MPQTKRSKKSAEQLARELVDRRLSIVGRWFGFTHGFEEVTEHEAWNAIVRSVQREEFPEVTRKQIDALEGVDEADDTLVAIEEGNATAGFLVGLELGRRLGGAR
jgi:hypothetical protein